jgi:drug/metabolite transporter (DMT)-like permease
MRAPAWRDAGASSPPVPEPRPARVSTLPVVLALATVYVVWGASYLAIRIALEGFPPLALAATRFTVAGAVLYFWLAARGAPRPTRAEWFNAFVAGTLLLAGGNGGVVVAEQWVGSGLGALGVAAAPLWTVAAVSLCEGRPRALEVAGLLVGLAGVAMLNAGTELRAEPAGAVALMLASLCWGAGSAWSRGRALPAGLMAPATQMIMGGLVLALGSVALGERLAAPPPMRAVVALGFLVVAGSLLAFSAFMYLLRRVRPALATSNAFVNPLVAVLLGALVAGEPIGAGEVLAMVTILGGVALVMTSR